MISSNSSDEENSAETVGTWETEQSSVAALDEIFAQYPNLWSIRKEVKGELVLPCYGQERKSIRIDRILIPKQEFVNRGWIYGAIGFECKRSGETLGPPIAQATDYARSLYKLDSGIKIWLDMVFIWPMSAQHGPLASILHHQRVGSACSNGWTILRLKLGETGILRIGKDGEIEFGNAPIARKVGSR